MDKALTIGSLGVFDYELPLERIAQRPAEYRDSCRLLVMKGNELEDRKFSEIPEFLAPGDLLILNNSRVFPGRFFVRIPSGAEVEILLLTRSSVASPEIGSARNDTYSNDGERWRALARPMKKLKQGEQFEFTPGVKCIVGERVSDGEEIELILRNNSSAGDLTSLLAESGMMPIPPYIRSGRADSRDREEYQTVYAEPISAHFSDSNSQMTTAPIPLPLTRTPTPGSLACPTAGLHFTEELLKKISERGVEIRFISLMVGRASFRMLSSEELEGRGELDGEWYFVDSELLDEIAECRKSGGKVVAVGTTTVRALESAALDVDIRDRKQGEYIESRLFIKPGFKFRAVDKLITNFHQPLSSHLALVSAFSGLEEIQRAYQHALSGDYRFLSYGDAMLLERGN